MITLCLDFGNTRQKCAVFNNAEIVDVVVLNTTSIEDLKNIIQQHQPTNSILYSVINHVITDI